MSDKGAIRGEGTPTPDGRGFNFFHFLCLPYQNNHQSTFQSNEVVPKYKMKLTIFNRGVN